MGQQASPAASPSASPVADQPLSLGSYDGSSLKVSIAMAETEAQVFNDVVVSGFKNETGGDIEVVNIEAVDVVRTLEAQVGGG